MRATLAAAAALAVVVSSASAQQRLRPRDIDALPASTPTAIVAYGTDPLQTGELRLPAGPGPFPVVVVIHGGCWTKGFATARNTAPIATALAERGVATWNLEYRQVGDDGGGWPGTFLDWGAGVDHLRALAKDWPLDLDRVVVAGHSAGGHAALWVAARGRLPSDSAVRGLDPLPIRGAVDIDGPGDLTGFVGADAERCGTPVVAALTGGSPAERPERYRDASPFGLLPLGVPQGVVTARFLRPDEADAYRAAAAASGDRVEVLRIDTGHFEVIAPGDAAWSRVEALIVDLLLR